MKIAFVDPFSGIAGDMTVAALLGLGMPLTTLEEGLAGLPLTGYRLSLEAVQRGAFAAHRFVVDVEDGHAHRGLKEVRRILDAGDLPDRVHSRALAAFTKLAEAEGRAHGKDPEEIHFHEVGAIDAIVDIVGAALGLEYFGVEAVVTTRVRVGTGEVECRHGWIPVPAPATLHLLEGFPMLLAEGEGETTTPTGAAMLAAWAAPVEGGFTFMPGATGYGAGSRTDTRLPNLLRITLGEISDPATTETVVELRANLDDQAPEGVAWAVERLMANGALDAWCTQVVMKKGRPGTVLSVLARESDVSRVEEVMFAETTTFGVRRATFERSVLDREYAQVETPYGGIRVKVGRRHGTVMTRSPEYEDCARVARERGVPLKEVYEAALAALRAAR
jgi:pyridinium-3,5-bisthiocarboxylic acid mononucleotide nickel chelatase